MKLSLEARNKMVVDNLGLVGKVAREYIGRGIDYDDLFQAGVIGLIVAVDKFDPSLGNKFSSFAVWWIMSKISRELFEHGRTVRLPEHVIVRYNKIYRAKDKLKKEGGREPTLQELSEETGLSVEVIQETLEKTQKINNLDESVWDDNGYSYLEAIEDREHDNFGDIERKLIGEQVRRIMREKLRWRYLESLEKRYGLDGQREMTNRQVAKEFGVSGQMVGQYIRKAIKTLEQSKELKELWEVIA